MNQRIRELALQAGCSIDGMGYGEGNIEGLAELIVRECGKIAFDDWCEGTNESSSEIAILKHFNVGVEQ